MNEPYRVLVIDDEPLNVDLLCQELETSGFELYTALDGPEGLMAAETNRPDVILLDIMMPGMDGFEVCRRLKRSSAVADVPVIFMTALTELADKVSAFEAGAADYVTKPFHTEELLARVQTHAQLCRTTQSLAERNRRLEAEIEAHSRAQRTIEALKDEIQSEFDVAGIIGVSPTLKAALNLLKQVAGTDTTVLVTGETGAGKELFARAVHEGSPRRESPLVKLNCAALPAELIESELFGHEEGAFTGATKRRKGRFELANGGSLFLDEVGELSLAAQAKLLRVLQEHEIERVGSSRTIGVDVRVIAATNRELQQATEKGTFRKDLYYRLNVFPIAVPPLRERPADLPLLAAHFATAAARKLGKRFADLDAEQIEKLQRYGWPGNVRELQNVVERAAIIAQDHRLSFDLPAGIASSREFEGGTLEDVERHYIWQILEELEWVVEGPNGAACRLGLNPSTLRGRMRKLDITKPR